MWRSDGTWRSVSERSCHSEGESTVFGACGALSAGLITFGHTFFLHLNLKNKPCDSGAQAQDLQQRFRPPDLFLSDFTSSGSFDLCSGRVLTAGGMIARPSILMAIFKENFPGESDHVWTQI